MWNQPIIKINAIDILLANVLKSWLTALLFTFWSLKYVFAPWNTDTLKGHLLSVELEACDFEHCINTSRVCCANSPPAPRGVICQGEGTWIVKALRITQRWFLLSCGKCDSGFLCLCLKGLWSQCKKLHLADKTSGVTESKHAGRFDLAG